MTALDNLNYHSILITVSKNTATQAYHRSSVLQTTNGLSVKLPLHRVQYIFLKCIKWYSYLFKNRGS